MNILVTGGHGFLGKHLVPHFKSACSMLTDQLQHQVLTPTHEAFDIASAAPWIALDKGQFDDIDIVINLAAYTNVPGAQSNSKTARHINSSTQWLNELPDSCQAYHMSTDYVYDGDVPSSKETDRLRPFNLYGSSKAGGDYHLFYAGRPNIHIIRTSFKPIKWAYPAAFDDMYTNADTVDIIAGMIAEFILTRPPGGVYNIGTERKTVFELAQRNNPDVGRTSVKNVSYLKPDVTMDLSKYKTYMENCRGKISTSPNS